MIYQVRDLQNSRGKSSKLRARRGSTGSIVYKSFHATRPKSAFFPRRSVKFRAQFVHRSDQRRDVFRTRALRNAVSQVEDVTGAAAEGLERSCDLLAHDLGRGEQHGGIEIALDRGGARDT